MSQKIAFFDIDGTLIDVPNGLLHPTQETIHALHAFQSAGNLIMVATARGTVPQTIQDIGFDGYICNDGHYITYHNETIADELFDANQIKRLQETFKKFGGKAIFAGHSGQWCDCAEDPYIVKHREMFVGSAQKPKDLVESFTNQDVHAISCCVLFDSAEMLWNCYAILEDAFTMIPYDKGLIRMDVYCKGFSKGSACEYMYKKLHIAKEDSYAFGDGVNDVEMLQLVGHGIAMGNAVESLKCVASDVTESVGNDGIQKAFTRYFGII